MVARSAHRYNDEFGVTIHYYRWDAPSPKAVVQLAHGVGEHALRYEELAQALVAAGYTVYADDHRGHGATGVEQHGGDLSRLGKLGPGGLRATIDAIRMFTVLIKSEHPELPVVLLGHSWGSLMAQIIVNTEAAEYDALVLTGNAYRVPGMMNSGDLNARHKQLGTTGYEWLSRDPAVAERFAADPLCFPADVLKLFGVLDALRLFGRPAKDLPQLPVLIMVGDDDTLGGERSAKALAEAYRKRSGLGDVSLRIWTGARHEIFNETNRAEVQAELIDWLKQRIVPPVLR